MQNLARINLTTQLSPHFSELVSNHIEKTYMLIICLYAATYMLIICLYAATYMLIICLYAATYMLTICLYAATRFSLIKPTQVNVWRPQL